MGRGDGPGELPPLPPSSTPRVPAAPRLPQGPQTGGPRGPPRRERRGQTRAACQPTLTFAFSKKPKEKPPPSIRDTGTDTQILWFGVCFFFFFFPFFPPFLCFFVFLQGREELFKPLLPAEFFWAQQCWVRLKGEKNPTKPRLGRSVGGSFGAGRRRVTYARGEGPAGSSPRGSGGSRHRGSLVKLKSSESRREAGAGWSRSPRGAGGEGGCVSKDSKASVASSVSLQYPMCKCCTSVYYAHKHFFE